MLEILRKHSLGEIIYGLLILGFMPLSLPFLFYEIIRLQHFQGDN